MKMAKSAVFILWVLLFCSISIAWSETRYISDQLVVSLRSQPQNNAEAITYLRTDTKVDIIGEDGAFYQVKTKDNEIGFIQKSYLVEDTPKAAIIKQISKENEKLKDRINTLEQQYQEAISNGDNAHLKLVDELKEARQLANDLQKDLDGSKSRFQKASNAFDTLEKNAKNVVEITADRDQLRASNEELSSKLDRIGEEKFALQKSKSIQWFLAGAGVLFVGWIIGKPRRRSSLY
jgi:SH3 domain protein